MLKLFRPSMIQLKHTTFASFSIVHLFNVWLKKKQERKSKNPSHSVKFSHTFAS